MSEKIQIYKKFCARKSRDSCIYKNVLLPKLRKVIKNDRLENL